MSHQGQWAPRPPAGFNGFGQPQGPTRMNAPVQHPQMHPPQGHFPPASSSYMNGPVNAGGPRPPSGFQPPGPPNFGAQRVPPPQPNSQPNPRLSSQVGPPPFSNSNAGVPSAGQGGLVQAPPSQKSSRGSSPVSGTAIDALEGQFTPGKASPAPGFQGTSGSPMLNHVQGNNSPRLQQPHMNAAMGPQGLSAPHFQAAAQQFPSQQPRLPHAPAHPSIPTQRLPHQQPVPSSMAPPPPGQNLLSSGPSQNMPPTTGSPAGFPPMPVRYPPPHSSSATGFAPPPPPAASGNQSFIRPQGLPQQRYPPLPVSNATHSGYPPPPGPGTAPTGFLPQSTPPQPSNMPPTSQYTTGPGMPQGPTGGAYVGQPSGQPSYMNSNFVNAMTGSLGQMSLQDSQRPFNLLQEKNLIPPEGIETAKPVLPHDFKKVNCSPDVFRCTLNAIPQTSGLLNKARLPLGILIHPFKDLSSLPVIQSSVIVRCRSCRTYINPFVVFIDQRRWKCNLCMRVNDLPEEFSFDPVSKTYGDPQRRPEVKSATIEFIAPSEYMLRPPQPAVYLFLLDVSFNAINTGYLANFCQILLDELDKLPGDARTSIGFMCYDRALYYFNLAEGLSQPQMLCVPDLEDPFLPCPDNLLVNLQESKELIGELLNQLPTLFEGNQETGSALGAALQSAHKMMHSTGGRITVMQTCLPTVGPGALQNRDTGSTGKNVTNIGPAIDFYKKLSLDCSASQIAVDLFMLNGQYADIATLSCISKFSAGCIYHFPSYHSVNTPSLVEKFDSDLRRYLTRKIGFESVMRIRCTRGLSIHTFHGNFFVRSTDLLSLPNINPDAGFGMQMSIEDTLNESTTVSFQAALLYTSSKGERRIRVHTLCVPVTNQLSEVFAQADQEAVVALLAKMAVDRSQNSALGDARDAMINAPVDTLGAYSQQMTSSQRAGALLAPHSLRLLPMFMLAMLKSVAFNLSANTKTDDRVFAMQQCKAQPVNSLIQTLYPHLYPLHRLSMETPFKRGKEEIPSAPKLQLSSANIDRTGLFLMDTGDAMYLLVGSAVGDQMCQDVFDKPNFMSLPDGMIDLPELENPTSEMVRSFVNYLMDSRANGITFLIIRDDSKHRHLFFQHMLEDRTENSMSYYEFLQFLQGKTKG